ncbi:hypothetical protein [Nannocystis sp.]|uniref:hypothetical protein n=1 Tax=Nannocystis sp. TaxID=1962667 RepID=UPI0025F9B002|nr:hypothetical protein [Nannocystis sp.]MBK7830369.1 hypothetical protein [Nannocystis sp.]
MALLTGACAPVARATLPTTPPRGAVRVDLEEMKECLQFQRRDAPRIASVERPELAVRLTELPPEVLRVARAAEVDALLSALLDSRDSTRDLAIAAKLHLVMRLSSLEIDVASLLFHTQCIGNQMDSVLRELDRRQRSREVALTVSSILMGAAAATAGGVWELRGGGGDGPAALGIVGGVTAASLGLAAFIPERRAVVFPHERNLLAPIARGEDPQGLYPSFVFRMLTTSPASGGPSSREEILEDWRIILHDAVPVAQRGLAESLLFGDGGVYDRRLLDVRERMFDVLESHVNAVDRDLELLYRFSSRLVAVTAPAGP